MLEVKGLKASIDGTEVLKGLDVSINAGEVHAIMGPNGAGKSTLSKVLAGHPDYEVTAGEVSYEVNFKKKNLMEMEPDERAREGMFLAFQYPIEIPGVNNSEFLRASFNAICRHQGVAELDPLDFQEFLEKKLELLSFDKTFASRQVNVDFSGGEKKKNEILQMAVLSPRLCFLDETDSGLDVDSLRVVSEGVNKLKNNNNAIVMVTHYQRLLDHIEPDFIHVLHDGQIVKTGDKTLAEEIEKRGYDWIIKGES